MSRWFTSQSRCIAGLTTVFVSIFSGCDGRNAKTSKRSPDGAAVEQNAMAVSSAGLPDYCAAKVAPAGASVNTSSAPASNGNSGSLVCIECQPGEMRHRACFADEKDGYMPDSRCRNTVIGDRHLVQCERTHDSAFMMDLRRHRAELLFEKMPGALDMVESFMNAKFRAELTTESEIIQLAGAVLKFSRAHGRNILVGKNLDLAASEFAREMSAVQPRASEEELAKIESAAKKSFASLAKAVAEGNLTSAVLLPAVSPLSEAIPALSHFKFLVLALLDKDGARVIEAAISPYSPDIARNLSALLEK